MNGAVMKSLLFTLLLLIIVSYAESANAQSGRVDLTQLDRLAPKAKTSVDVNIDERLIQLTAKFLSDKDSDEAKLKELVLGLKGIYVRNFEFEQDGEYLAADLESIRNQLGTPGWTRVVNVRSKSDGNIEVYLMTTDSKVGGLTLLAAEPNELTVVNIIGPVDLDKLSALEGQFGIPELNIETAKPKKN
jgi:Domain of unknown function (DUF4252)